MALDKISLSEESTLRFLPHVLYGGLWFLFTSIILTLADWELKKIYREIHTLSPGEIKQIELREKIQININTEGIDFTQIESWEICQLRKPTLQYKKLFSHSWYITSSWYTNIMWNCKDQFNLVLENDWMIASWEMVKNYGQVKINEGI